MPAKRKGTGKVTMWLELYLALWPWSWENIAPDQGPAPSNTKVQHVPVACHSTIRVEADKGVEVSVDDACP